MAASAAMQQTSMPTDRPFTYDEIVAAGYDADDIRQAVRHGLWIRMRRKVFVTAELHAAAATSPTTAHALQVQCLILALSRVTVAAAALSAARIHGIELLRPAPPDLVLATADPGVTGTHRNGYYLRATALPSEHMCRRFKIPVTTVARTLFDLASDLPFAETVVATESALRSDLVTHDELHEVLEWATGRPGVTRAREALLFATAENQTVLESLSRARMYELGLPLPKCQARIVVDGVVSYLDFDWAPELDLSGEADGMEKYLPNGGTDRQATLQAIRDEKAREQRVLKVRSELVRWGWREANDPNLLAALLRPAIARAQARRRLTG
jgi:hypothetical protein